MTTATLEQLIADFKRCRPEMRFADVQAATDAVAPLAPEQAAYDLEAARDAIRGCRTVAEIGGWRGDLAQDLCVSEDIEAWTNYELSRWAVDHTTCVVPAYRAVVLETWPAETPMEPADILVMTHVVEHMEAGELLVLIRRVRHLYPRLYVEAPLPVDAIDFDWEWDVSSMHVLAWGWRQVDAALAVAGYRARGCVVPDQGDDRVERRCVTYDRYEAAP